MNRAFALLTILIISYLVYGFYLSLFQFQVLPATRVNKKSLFYDYKVTQNIHTNMSTGSGSYDSIAEEARNAGQNFILFTDTDPKYDLLPDYYNKGLGILFGKKIFTEKGKYLFYSPDNKNRYNSASLAISAHPLDHFYDPAELLNPTLNGFEVLNLKKTTQQAWSYSKLSTLWSLIFYPFNPRLALMRLFQEPKMEFSLFDTLSQKRKINFYLGTEATARAIPFADWLVKFPSYERSLSIASEHILSISEMTGQMSLDNKTILDLLKKGQFYIAFDELAPARGFEIYLDSPQSKRKILLGESVNYRNGLKLHYKLPAEPIIFYEVVLLKNGSRVDHLNTAEGLFTLTSPGVYRVQVRLSPQLPLPDATKWLTWIYTNNFYIKSTSTVF